MPLIFLSTFEFCASSSLITLSLGVLGPTCVTVPSMRPPVAPPAVPAVIDPRGAASAFPPDGDPDEFAVPAPLVPGALFTARLPLPAPLGSFPELFRPAALPGPVTPLAAELPAPADPALGAAPGLVLGVPAAAGRVAPPPPEAPPADPPPPPPPPPPWAIAGSGDSRIVTIKSLPNDCRITT